MTTNTIQAPIKLSFADILEAIKQLSKAERHSIWNTLLLTDSDLNVEPLPYVITLREGIPVDEQLDEIWRKRGPIDWSVIDDIAVKMDIQEPIEELLQSLTA